jgi:N-acetylglucosaminyl-diphospho-decaprenol L-rhamnosyltransferase
MNEVAAIIVTHNSQAAIGCCLDSLQGRTDAIVIDNASSDDSVNQARKRDWATVIANPANRGFAGAVNQGARLTETPYLLLLNPDTELLDDLAPLTEACQEHGIAAGCLVGQNGKPQTGFTVRAFPTPAALIFECLGINRLWPGNPVNRRYRCSALDLSRPQQVDQPAGAFLMIRRDVFETLQGFDESFWPVWFEDVDFCFRAVKIGLHPVYIPRVRAVHEGGHSVRQMDRSNQPVHWYGSLLKYVVKHYPPSSFRAVCLAVTVGSLVRMGTGVLGRRRGTLLRAYGNVIRLALRGLLSGSTALRGNVPLTEDGGVRLEPRISVDGR